MTKYTFHFECSECNVQWYDEVIEEKTMESECGICGNWEYAKKPYSSENGYDTWGRKTKELK